MDKNNKKEEKKFHPSREAEKLCQDPNCKGTCLNVHLKPAVLKRQYAAIPKYNIEKEKDKN